MPRLKVFINILSLCFYFYNMWIGKLDKSKLFSTMKLLAIATHFMLNKRIITNNNNQWPISKGNFNLYVNVSTSFLIIAHSDVSEYLLLRVFVFKILVKFCPILANHLAYIECKYRNIFGMENASLYWQLKMEKFTKWCLNLSFTVTET